MRASAWHTAACTSHHPPQLTRATLVRRAPRRCLTWAIVAATQVCNEPSKEIQPHALVEHYRSTRGGADTILAGPVQIRFAIMLAADVVCVLTCRAHPDKRINELGPVRRALRCGIFFGAVSISQAEAEIVTTRASDFCLFAVTAEEIRRRELRHAEQMEKNGDRWGSGLEATACGPLARVVVRVIRCATVGAALLPPVFTLGAPFDHGGCLRDAPAAAAAKGAPPSKRKRPRGGR